MIKAQKKKHKRLPGIKKVSARAYSPLSAGMAPAANVGAEVFGPDGKKLLAIQNIGLEALCGRSILASGGQMC